MFLKPQKNTIWKCIILAFLIALILSGWRIFSYYERNRVIYLQLLVKSSQSGMMALYYDQGQGFNDRDVSTIALQAGQDDIRYRFPIPNRSTYLLRLDPPPKFAGALHMKDLQLVDASGRVLKTFQADQVQPLFQIESIRRLGAGINIRPVATGEDPQLRLVFDAPWIVKQINPVYLLRIFGEFLLVFLLASGLLLFAAGGKDRGFQILLVIAVLMVAWRIGVIYDRALSSYVEILMQSSTSGKAVLYFDRGYGFNEADADESPVLKDGGLHPYRFNIGRENLNALRFDPLASGGQVEIARVAILDGIGRIRQNISLQQLRPLQQIEKINVADRKVIVKIRDGETDPQLEIFLNSPLLLETYPSHWTTVLLRLFKDKELFVLSLFFLGVLYMYRKRQTFISSLWAGDTLTVKCPLIYLGVIGGMILAMVFVSGVDVHPDELGGHAKAVDYYVRHWFPPAVDNPSIAESITVFGASYLFRLEVVYFLAGKVIGLFQGGRLDSYLLLRLFNAALFVLLIAVIARRADKLPSIVLCLMLSPQIWYIFSYFNGDAFPFFLAFMVVIQMVDPHSATYSYLKGERMTIRTLWGGLVLGGLLGCLLISKMNYLFFVLFVGLFALWTTLFGNLAASLKIKALRRWVGVALAALAIFFPLYIYDQAINGFEKDARIAQMAEQHAINEFKASTFERDRASSHPELRLRERGVSWQDLFIKKTKWRDLTWKSFLGYYGYMNLPSADLYYHIMGRCWALFLLMIFLYVLLQAHWREQSLFMAGFVLVIAMIVMSAYRSWTADYEPQGRYLFPLLPMFALCLSRLAPSFQRKMTPVFSGLFFILSAWSFTLTALFFIPKIN